MQVYAEYLRKAIALAARGSVQGALNWSQPLGIGAIGALAHALGVDVIFSPGSGGTVVSFFVYAILAWVLIFLVRLIFVAPYQLWRDSRPEIAPVDAKRQEYIDAIWPSLTWDHREALGSALRDGRATGSNDILEQLYATKLIGRDFTGFTGVVPEYQALVARKFDRDEELQLMRRSAHLQAEHFREIKRQSFQSRMGSFLKGRERSE